MSAPAGRHKGRVATAMGKSFYTASAASICKTSQVRSESAARLYYYFTSKEEILASLLEEVAVFSLRRIKVDLNHPTRLIAWSDKQC